MQRSCERRTAEVGGVTEAFSQKLHGGAGLRCAERENYGSRWPPYRRRDPSSVATARHFRARRELGAEIALLPPRDDELLLGAGVTAEVEGCVARRRKPQIEVAAVPAPRSLVGRYGAQFPRDAGVGRGNYAASSSG